MNVYAIEHTINQAAVPVLNKALAWVREKKETAMAVTYGCPVEGCGLAGRPTKRGVRRHMTVTHKIPKAEQPEPVESGVAEEGPPVEAAPTPARQAPTKAALTLVVEEKAVEEEPQSEPEPESLTVSAASSQITLESSSYVPPSEDGSPAEPSSVEPPSVEPPTPAPTPAPPAEAAQTAAPPVDMTSVPLYTAIRLNGPVWWQHPGTSSWEGKVAADLTVQVIQRELSSGGTDVMLLCRAEGGAALWSVREREVLGGSIKIVKLPPSTVPSTKYEARPLEGVRDVQDPEFDYFKEESAAREVAEAKQKERLAYGELLTKYLEARDRMEAASKVYRDVENEVCGDLQKYIREYGEPSDPGKDNVEMIDFDVSARITRKPSDGTEPDTFEFTVAKI